METQAVKQRLPKRINEEQLRTSLLLSYGVICTESCFTNHSYPAILPVIEVDFYGASAPFVLEQSHVWYEASRASQRGLIFLSH